MGREFGRHLSHVGRDGRHHPARRHLTGADARQTAHPHRAAAPRRLRPACRRPIRLLQHVGRKRESHSHQRVACVVEPQAAGGTFGFRGPPRQLGRVGERRLNPIVGPRANLRRRASIPSRGRTNRRWSRWEAPVAGAASNKPFFGGAGPSRPHSRRQHHDRDVVLLDPLGPLVELRGRRRRRFAVVHLLEPVALVDVHHDGPIVLRARPADLRRRASRPRSAAGDRRRANGPARRSRSPAARRRDETARSCSAAARARPADRARGRGPASRPAIDFSSASGPGRREPSAPSTLPALASA